jgi:hypothetical protein
VAITSSVVVYGNYILDYTGKKMNKINGQADTKRIRHAKSVEVKTGREEIKPKITREMIDAGVSVIEDAVLGASLAEGISGQAQSLSKEVFLAMARLSPDMPHASKGHKRNTINAVNRHRAPCKDENGQQH